MDTKPAITPEREAFYDKIATRNLAPLWQVLHTLVTKEPHSDCQPYLWKYDEVRSLLGEAGNHISAAEAERRVLILENPGLRGQSRITTSLFAGLQLVLPGEIAPAHRHSQSALRFVLEGGGAHTTVDGEKTYMMPGDFVITPSGTWHDHGNETRAPMVWLDGLDIPLVKLLDASFAERYPTDAQEPTRPAGDSHARYGSNLMPVDHKPSSMTSPIFNYPYAETRRSLEVMKKQTAWDACHGLKLRYSNPETGGYAMPTIGAFIQLLPKGFQSSRYRSTDATVYVCIEGRGVSRIGNKSFAWGPRDIFVAPSWHWTSHEPEIESVLFSYSDRPVHEKLGLWREDRGNA
jgi:gentisate 1,2-dioxygenase